MAKHMRKMVLLAKIQTAAGTDPIPAGAVNGMLCRGITPRPVVAETVNRDLIRPYFGNSGQIIASVHAEVEFEVELAGAGEPGELPAYDPLLRACGFSATVVADTSVTYAPVSDDIEFVAFYLYVDKVFHKMIDCRGTVAVDFSARSIPIMRFRFMGTYAPITDATNPASVSYSKFQMPKAVNKANTPEWSLFGHSGCLQSLSIDMQNNLVFRSLIGCEGAEITNRQPSGSAVMELPTIAAFNWPQTVVSGTTGALDATHGTVAGNIVEINAPKVQLLEPSYSDQDGVAMLNTNLSPQPDTGNDEVSIVVR